VCSSRGVCFPATKIRGRSDADQRDEPPEPGARVRCSTCTAASTVTATATATATTAGQAWHGFPQPRCAGTAVDACAPPASFGTEPARGKQPPVDTGNRPSADVRPRRLSDRTRPLWRALHNGLERSLAACSSLLRWPVMRSRQRANARRSLCRSVAVVIPLMPECGESRFVPGDDLEQRQMAGAGEGNDQFPLTRLTCAR
jgi:hypothetical protein